MIIKRLDPLQELMTAADFAQHLLDEPDTDQRIEWLSASEWSIELVEAFKNEVDRHKDADSAKALLAGERAIEASGYVSDPQARPLALWAYALGLTVRGSFAEAVPVFSDARKGYEVLGHTENATRVGVRQIQAQAMMGDMAGALALADQTRSSFIELGLLQDAASVSINMGIIHYRMGRMPEAEEALHYALEQMTAIGDAVGAGKAHSNLALVYQDQDRFAEAVLHFQAALAIFREQNMPEVVAGNSLNLALLYRKEGRLTQALDLLSRVRATYAQQGDHPDAVYAQLEEARIHLDLNLLSEAEKLSQELIGIFSAKGMQLERSEALMTLGSAQAKGGKLTEARRTLEQAREGWLTLENALQASLVDTSIATLLLESGRQGDLSALEQAVIVANQALVGLENFPSAKALTLSVLAEALLDLGNLEGAKHHLSQAAALTTSLGIPDLTIRVERLLGQVALQDGDPAQAETHFKEAIERLEGVRASLSVDEFKSAYLGDKLEVYGDLVDLLIDETRYSEAFEFAERAKSRALVDLLARSGERLETAQDPQIERLQLELTQARAHLNKSFLAAEVETNSGVRGEHWQQLVEAEEQVTTLIRELERLQPQTALLQQVQEFSLADFNYHLEPGTLVLEYFQTQGGLMAFVLEEGNVRVVRGLGMPEQVQQHLEQLEFFLSRVAQGEMFIMIYGEAALRQSVDHELQALHRILIEPLGLSLSGKPLVIVPHGVLHSVPFAALFDGSNYLIDQAAISFSPSASVYALCRQRSHHSEGSLVAFGVPIENIPQAIEEVERISQIAESPAKFVGEEASLENFFASASDAQVLHVATHGAFRPDNPMFSGLRMSNGWLAARDLYNLRLKAELVVLSACETGLAKQASGDELLGLARGFLYAGAPCLIASLWPVRDEATALFMTDFYSRLREGKPVATAMREAQLALREQYPNPYYWAAFTVTGDSHRTVKI